MAFSLTSVTGSAVDISPSKVAGPSFADDCVAGSISVILLPDAFNSSCAAKRTLAVIDLAKLSAYSSADLSGCLSTIATSAV